MKLRPLLAGDVLGLARAGTRRAAEYFIVYRFAWAMGDDNQEFADIDAVLLVTFK